MKFGKKGKCAFSNKERLTVILSTYTAYSERVTVEISSSLTLQLYCCIPVKHNGGCVDDSNKSKSRVRAMSGHATPGKPKRPFSEIANSSAEELVSLSQQIDELSSEMKGIKYSVSKIMTKDGIKLFIKPQ